MNENEYQNHTPVKKKRRDIGKYSFNTAKSKDFKSISRDQNELLINYRNSVEEVLTKVKRTPIEQNSNLRHAVTNLKK